MEKYNGRGLSGMVNFGNTCYMNSAIQCMSNTHELTEYFLSKKFVSDFNQKSKNKLLVTEWYRLINAIYEENCTISPLSFFKTINKLTENNIDFHAHMQNDVQEFLVLLIDNLHDALSKEVVITISGNIINPIDKMAVEAMNEWKKFFKQSYSKIIDLFYGQIVSIIYKDNEIKSKTYSPMCFFNLPLPNQDNISIYDCFDMFTAEEILEGDNQWKCDKTNEYMDVKKTIKVWNFPKILILCFKRFNNYGQKINKFIDYPLDNLNLSKYCIGYERYKCNYELYGICNHSGTLHFGHYYSYCKNSNGNWYSFNDKNVSKIDENKVKTNNSYVLFYRKKRNTLIN